jgi:hypothetical protein
MAQEFGKRGTRQAEAKNRVAGESIFSAISIPSIEPMQLLQGAGFILLGLILSNIAISILFHAKPEFYKVVVMQPRVFDELPDGTTKEVIYVPKERPKS